VLDVLLVVEEVARSCGVTARIVVEGSLGVVGALTAYGTEAQKRRYFPWVLETARSRPSPSPSPRPAPPPTDLVTRADEAPEGWTLGGEKRWITGAGTSRLYLVYCRMGIAPAPRASAASSSSATRPASRSASATAPWGCAGSRRGACASDRCRVPAEQVLVGARPTASSGSCARTTASAWSGHGGAGAGAGAYEHALAYAQSRRQFGRPSRTSRASAGSWPTWRSSSTRPGSSSTARRHLGDGFPEPLAAAKAKTFAAEMAQEVTNQALQIHGAAGYGRGLPLERMVRDARMFAIGGGRWR
jgi:alkylation response protein AidB-like acyl-CoA dehydrogenase